MPPTAALWLSWSLVGASPAFAQTSALWSRQATPPIGAGLCAPTLRKLPLGNNVFTALETTQSEVIADRFNGGGLNVGEKARAAGFLASWSQTAFKIGDIDVTDPSGSGAPLVFPDLELWDCISVATGLMPADFNPPGTAVRMLPARRDPNQSSAGWRTSIDGSVSGGSLASADPSGAVPPIARLNDYGYASVLASGSVVPNRLGLVAGGRWERASKFLREVTPAADSHLASGFANLTFTPSSTIESDTLVWIQGATVPFAYRSLFDPDATTEDRAVHVQSSLQGPYRDDMRWMVSGGFTQRSTTNDLQGVSAITANRLSDGPISAIAAATSDQSTGRWTVNGRLQLPARGRHLAEFGAGIDRSFLRSSNSFRGSIREFVDTLPGRLWSFTSPGEESHRHATTISAFAMDRIQLRPNLALDGALRFEAISGSADGAANGVGWRNVLPRAVLRWDLGNKTLTGGYRRSGNRLNLDLLAYGDPAAETAIVTRLLPAPLAAAAILDRVGPGTGGNPQFSRIDQDLKRPVTDEYIVGIESTRRGWLRVGLTGIARREPNLIAVADAGVPITSYSTIGIPDPGHDFVSAADDQIITVYNRLPSSFGRNQYLVINSDEKAATAFALKLWADGSTDRLTVLFGATASMAQGSAASRGYGPLENDQDIAGELLSDPNATTFARGRLFSDRAFTIKWMTTYEFPKQISVGAIARYQDGQPFARLVLAPELNQGPELIRAYPNAGNRFTFTGTLDIRVQKGFSAGGRRIDAIVDFYNLATRSNEVEEYTVTGPNFRTPTAIEPPRAIHLGFRLTL